MKVEDKVKVQWNKLTGKLKTKWGRLTEKDLKVADGNSEYLSGRIQERYGLEKDEANRQVEEFGRNL